jgi:sigma-B regulation protein RsbU (phosphoserine phosphatase)
VKPATDMSPTLRRTARPDGAPAGARLAGQAVAVVAILYLAGMVTADFLLPTRYVLIDLYEVAPLIAATMLGWRLTGTVGLLAVVAGVVAAEFDDHDLIAAPMLLRLAGVAAAGLTAVFIAIVRERREQRLAAITEVAEVAEHAIVRAAPIVLPDLEVRTLYRSASRLASVGGDLYEAVSTPYGSRLVIGDAKGKGLPAVQLAAIVLGAFRHAAFSERDLGRLATDLDRTVAAFATEEDFVTALIVEAADLEVRIVCCGHPWPLIGPPGYVRPIPLETGLPLGLGGPRPVQVRGYPTRQIFVAYTDGLIESKNPGGEVLDVAAIASAVQAAEPEAAVEALDRLIRAHVAGHVQDDVTILAMKRIPD